MDRRRHSAASRPIGDDGDLHATGDITLSVRRLTRKLWALSVGANFLVVLAFYVGLLSWHNAYFPKVAVGGLLGMVGTIGLLYFSAAATHAYLITKRAVGPALGWMAEQRGSTEKERTALAAVPRRTAGWAGFYWLVTPIWGIPFFRRMPDYQGVLPTFLIVKVLVAWVALGFAATMLSYLLVERGLRNVRAQAFVGETMLSENKTMGMFTKLILAWAGAALLPIGAMALYLVGTTAEQRLRSAPVIWTTGGVGLLAGVFVTIFAAQAIVNPINRVRRGLRRIGEGHLDTIDVDEAGELGLLQAGVNEMVIGLRDRERMRELFGHHVGPEVASRALSGEFALGGERRCASAMFVDVIASTTIAETRAPEDVVSLLNSFFDAVVRCVGDESGLINKFQGDGAVCIFGAPVDQDDHAARALRCARALAKELKAVEGIEAAIGVSSGDVVAGNVGAADRYEFTVVGDPVNEASRLTDEAKSRGVHVLAGERSIGLAGAEADNWTNVGAIALRGRKERTIAFEPA